MAEKKNGSAKYAGSSWTIIRVTVVGITANLVLIALKTVVGLIFGNLSVISDAIHSASDVLTSLLILVAVPMSSHKRDKEHNYGHEKIEPLFTLFFALVLAVVGGVLAWQGIKGIISPEKPEVNAYLIGVTVLSVLVKEAMFRYGIYHAKKLNSEILKADAWHARSDSLSSVAVLVGLITGLFLQTNIAESIVVLIVSALILKVAFDIFLPAINQLTDKAASDETCEKIKQTALSADGVKSVDRLRTRIFGNTIFVDIEIAVDGSLTVDESSKISLAVHDTLEAREDLRIKHCTVCVHSTKRQITDETDD